MTGDGNEMKDLQETYGNQRESLNGDREIRDRWTGRMAN
jgi:hypothetical protein